MESFMPNKPTAESKPYSISFYVILGAALLAFIRTFSLLSPILLSLLLVLLISLAINPVITWMRARKGGRKIPTGLVTMGSIIMIGLIGWALFGPMKSSVVTISRTLPGYWERLQKPLIKIEQQSVIFENKLQAEVSTEIAENSSVPGNPKVLSSKKKPAPPASPKAVDTLRASLSKMIRDALGSFTSVAFNGAQILVVLVTVFFGVVFMLMNPRPIFGTIIALFPERHHDQVVTILQRIGKFVPIWASATLLGMVTIGLLVFMLMWPIFGFMDALVLGLVACVLEAIPFLGPILSAVPALLLAVGQGGLTPVWVVLVYMAIQGFENNVIIPYIMARRMNLHPLAVIFSMLLSIAAFGVLGVLIAAPMVAVVTILHEELYRKRFLPTTTNAELDHLAGIALHEKHALNTSPLATDAIITSPARQKTVKSTTRA